MTKFTKKEAAAYLKVTPTRVQQLMAGMLCGEDYWYEQVGGLLLCMFSEEAVQRMANRNTAKTGRPRKRPISDAPKRPRGRPKKESPTFAFPPAMVAQARRRGYSGAGLVQHLVEDVGYTVTDITSAANENEFCALLNGEKITIRLKQNKKDKAPA